MELKKLTEEIKKIFEITNTNELSNKLHDICLNNKHEYYDKFVNLVNDLSIDWLQKIYQYYEADRKDKKQDYTPPSIARFIGKLTEADNESTVLDLCAGSGALTIQKWNLNHNLKFICKEYDENVIPFLIFNLAVRNIEGQVVHTDVLQDEIYSTYYLSKTDKYSIVKEG